MSQSAFSVRTVPESLCSRKNYWSKSMQIFTLCPLKSLYHISLTDRKRLRYNLRDHSKRLALWSYMLDIQPPKPVYSCDNNKEGIKVLTSITNRYEGKEYTTLV